MFFFEHHGMDASEPFRLSTLINGSFSMHLHRAYEVLLVKSGSLRVHVNQREFLLAENDAAFIFSNQLHSFTTPKDSIVNVIIFAPELVGNFYSDTKDMLPENNVIHVPHLPNLEHLDSCYGQKSFLYGLCDQLLRSTRLIPVETSSKIIIFQQILAYVDRHYLDAACSLKAVAKSLQYDYAYLSKLFSQLAETSFTQYLNHYRISQACYLLKNSQFTVSEISERCGYQNLRTFHRNFHGILGCSPIAYQLRKNVSVKINNHNESIRA